MKKGLITFIFWWIISITSINIFIFAIPTSFNGKTIIEVVTAVGFIYAASSGYIPTVDFEELKACIKYTVHNQTEVEEYYNLARRILNSADVDIILGKFGTSFWIGYAVIIASYLILLICGIIAFSEKNSQKRFYKLPLVTNSYIDLALITLLCILCMFIPKFPAWLCVILCVITILSNVASLLLSGVGGAVAEDIDEKIQETTSFIKDLTSKAKLAYEAAEDKEEKKNLKEVYEAFRYANPMSNEKTKEVEKTIEIAFANKNYDMLKNLIKERNELCKK